jgi:nucleoside-diphosphate-sugar epimerase
MTTVDEAGSQDAATAAGPAPTDQTSRRERLARPRILVVGHGDVGRRLVAVLGARHRVFATTRTADRIAALREQGVVPVLADLDEPATLGRLAGLAPVVVHLAPPQRAGPEDRRTRALLQALRGVSTLVYVSTTGVYGDCNGAVLDETRTVAPMNDRAQRRVDAERRLRLWALATGATVVIIRAPGIYAADRLPLARIVDGTPTLTAADDVRTNHIHADDLARIVAAAIHRGAQQRVYHAVDDTALSMSDWLDRVADAFRVPRPERMSREALADRVSPMRLSFMRESRRLTNRRLREELGIRLRYPTVDAGLAGIDPSHTPDAARDG